MDGFGWRWMRVMDESGGVGGCGWWIRVTLHQPRIRSIYIFRRRVSLVNACDGRVVTLMADGNGRRREYRSRSGQQTTNDELHIPLHEQSQQSAIAWDSGLMVFWRVTFLGDSLLSSLSLSLSRERERERERVFKVSPLGRRNAVE